MCAAGGKSLHQVLETDHRVSTERVEDAALLAGAGRYLDDLAEPPRTLHAAILRSPHAHARITSLDTSTASALDGIVTIITGADFAKIADPLMVGVKIPIHCWPLAQDKVRYAGEPVAVVLA
ncbi:MAG: hypothetical protein KDJ69_06025, partial [Nitratireductor sp.]|nr:hypothetical protein [Nitratireductor sp.]